MTNGIRKTRVEAAATMAVDHIAHLYAADFAAIASGKMRAIVLRDSAFMVCDTLIFFEVDKSQIATGAKERRTVTHIKTGHGLQAGFVVLLLAGVH